MNRHAGAVRPTPELLAALRAGKSALRDERRAMSLPEKVRAVIELQRACLPLLARQRPLDPWEKVWSAEPCPRQRTPPGHAQSRRLGLSYPPSPVGTIAAVSTISTTVRSGARVRWTIPRGTTSPWRGASSTMRSGRSIRRRPSTT